MLKLNIFILEDSLSRIEYFKKQFGNHTITIYDEINEGMYYTLQNLKFDIIFLDHDMSDHLVKKLTVENGNDVAKYMVKNELQKQAIIYVHSMNPIGGNNIYRTLDDAGYEVQWIPFHLLKQCGGLDETKN